jgi:hypothetical protein
MTIDEQKDWESVQRQAVGLLKQSSRKLGQHVDIQFYPEPKSSAPVQNRLDEWRERFGVEDDMKATT